MQGSKRDKYLKKKYGIDEKEYNKIVRRQGHKCAICRKPKTHFSKRLAVDHDHSSGEVRGALCFYCNKRVVGRHNKESVKKLVAYILPEYLLVLKETI